MRYLAALLLAAAPLACAQDTGTLRAKQVPHRTVGTLIKAPTKAEVGHCYRVSEHRILQETFCNEDWWAEWKALPEEYKGKVAEPATFDVPPKEWDGWEPPILKTTLYGGLCSWSESMRGQ